MSPAGQGLAESNIQREATVVEDGHRTECSYLPELQPSQVEEFFTGLHNLDLEPFPIAAEEEFETIGFSDLLDSL